ncbi:MAG TPA: response regulator [Cryomorphaceae bacterium]|nr:response regulator [Cryomorphaceae bacterium]
MKTNLILVDDDPIFQFGMQHLVKGLAMQVNLKVFSSGVELLEFLSAADPDEIPDVILLDLNMPVMNGWEVLDRLKDIELGKKVAIYVCSSSINPSDIRKAKEINIVSEYIIKPLNLEELDELLDEAK